MLVMIKAILYERTVALCASMDLGEVWEDLSLEVTAAGLGGGRRLRSHHIYPVLLTHVDITIISHIHCHGFRCPLLLRSFTSHEKLN